MKKNLVLLLLLVCVAYCAHSQNNPKKKIALSKAMTELLGVPVAQEVPKVNVRRMVNVKEVR